MRKRRLFGIILLVAAASCSQSREKAVRITPDLTTDLAKSTENASRRFRRPATGSTIRQMSIAMGRVFHVTDESHDKAVRQFESCQIANAARSA